MSDTISRAAAIDVIDRAVTKEAARWSLRELPSARCVHINDIYRLIAGHSNYHGDNILAALTCLAEGKEVPNPITVLDAQPERDIPLECITDEGGNAICPKCGANVEWHKYCEECGQALRWKE